MDIFGILAHPAGQSLSPLIHNAGYKALHIDAEYKAFDVTPDKLDTFFAKVVDKKVGLSVSMPYKEVIQKYCGEVSVAAQRIGAVNTIYWREGKMIGHNTDFMGIRKPLQEVVDLEDKRVVILGAGGAAKAAAYGCVLAGAHVTILNRSVDRAKEIAENFSCEYGELSAYDKESADVIIQTTTVGMMTKETLFEEKDFREGQVVFDIVYHPRKTKFLENAEKAGATIITGDKMFLVQAYEQFKLFTGKDAPQEVMEKLLDEKLK